MTRNVWYNYLNVQIDHQITAAKAKLEALGIVTEDLKTE